MSAKLLETLGKMFTDEAIDVILREGLLDYYNMIASCQVEEAKRKGFPSSDYVYNARVMKALVVVIEDFMPDHEYKLWLSERAINPVMEEADD